MPRWRVIIPGCLAIVAALMGYESVDSASEAQSLYTDNAIPVNSAPDTITPVGTAEDTALATVFDNTTPTSAGASSTAGEHSDAGASSAAGEHSDPHDIILGAHSWRYWSLGDFVHEVWVCGGHNADYVFDPVDVAERLNFWLRPYFRQLSANRFNMNFTAGGKVKTNTQCSEVIRAAAAADTSVSGNGALVVYEATGGDGYTYYKSGPRSYPDNEREAFVSAAGIGWTITGGMHTAPHEILHQTFLDHTYGRSDSVYDNPMDIISGAGFTGTVAPHRYANGWIDSSEVVVHPQISGAIESVTYELFRPGVEGTQMLVLPRPDGYSCGSYDSRYCFWTLGARIRAGLDLVDTGTVIPAEGVEVYAVSQANGGGHYRRTEPVPPLPEDWTHEDRTSNHDHVYGVGGSHTIRGWRFEVTERHRDSYEVWVGDKNAPSAIASDSFSVTEADSALSLSWTAPADNGRPLQNYTVQWRLASAAADASWNSAVVTAPAAAHTITGLDNNRRYLVRMRANNSAGAGPWRKARGTPRLTAPGNTKPLFVGHGNPDDNYDPVGNTYSFNLSEHASGREAPLVVGAVKATDADPGDTLQYEITSLEAKATSADKRARKTFTVHNKFQISDNGDIVYTGTGLDHRIWYLRLPSRDSWELGSDYTYTVELAVSVSDGRDDTGDTEHSFVSDASTTVVFTILDENDKPIFREGEYNSGGYKAYLTPGTPGSVTLKRVDIYDLDTPEKDLDVSITSGDPGNLFQVVERTRACPSIWRCFDLKYTGTGEQASGSSNVARHDLTLAVTDGLDDSGRSETTPVTDDTQVLRVVVCDRTDSTAVCNEKPVFDETGSGYGFTIAENPGGASSTVVLGTVTATDPDGDRVYCTLSGGPPGLWVDLTTCRLGYTGTGFDYETNTTPKSFTISISDRVDNLDNYESTVTADATAALSFQVTDVNEPPTFSQSLYTATTGTLPDGSATPVKLLDVIAADPDINPTLEYSITTLGIGESNPLIDPADESKGRKFEVTSSGAVRYRGTGETLTGAQAYEFKVSVADGGGMRVSVPVTIGPGYRTPRFPNGSYTASLAENTDGTSTSQLLLTAAAVHPDGSTLTYTIDASRPSESNPPVDPNDISKGRVFTIDANGELRYQGNAIDYETTSTRTFKFRIQAADSSNRTAQAHVTVNITDENEPPAFTKTSYSASLAVGADGSTTPVALSTVTAEDPDSGDELTYSISNYGDGERNPWADPRNDSKGRKFAISPSGATRYQGSGEQTAGTTYKFKLRATDSTGLTATTPMTVVTIVPPAPPPATPPGDTTPAPPPPPPAPPAAEPGLFTDIVGNIHHAAILSIARAGVTRGCNIAGTLFCPDKPVTRAQMAAFLTRALNLPAPTNTGRFTDIAGNIHHAAILSIARAGVTRGCNTAGTLFCPDKPVTRAQMAAFLTRALNLPAPTNTGRFTDIADNTHTSAITAIAHAGITRGCNTAGTLFCPDKPVTRAQMATFLNRALNLSPST